MRLFKIILLAACFTAAGCEKNNDSVKESLENAIPDIQITSMGMIDQVGPFSSSDAIRVTFGGAVTRSEPGSIAAAWYDVPSGAAQPALMDSIYFDSWNTAASAANGNNSVETGLVPTTYPNTLAFTGNAVLKLAKLPPGKPYTLRLYARTADGKMATVAVSRFITIR